MNSELKVTSAADVINIINPANKMLLSQVRSSTIQDVDRAVSAARSAFNSGKCLEPNQAKVWLNKLLCEFVKREWELADVISAEIGAPITMARHAQASAGKRHIDATLRALDKFDFESDFSGYRIIREPVGVCGLITPWNWPVGQIFLKLLPALVAGCSVVLKPSEHSVLSALIIDEIIRATDLCDGVFNMVIGDGFLGQAIADHREIDMVSFTGSTASGVQVLKTCSRSIKRVALELGGKSPHILLDDVDLDKAVTSAVNEVMYNSGQSCDGPTRLLVQRNQLNTVINIARQAASSLIVGDPTLVETDMGPVANMKQFLRVRTFIEQALTDNLEIITGGLDLPKDLENGLYILPTIVVDMDQKSIVSKEEIFGPVLSIVPYDTDDHAVELANDTNYGLAAYIQSADHERAYFMSKKIRSGMIHLNCPPWSNDVPFGGFKQSGLGREGGVSGLESFTEIKAVLSSRFGH